MTNIKRMKLFTNNDLDGVSCSILFKLITKLIDKNIQFDVEYCDYNNIDKNILSFLSSEAVNDYFSIFITSIYVNNTTAEELEKFHDDENLCNILLLDYHKIASYLNKYAWAKVIDIDEHFIETSGTYLVYKYLSSLLTNNYNSKEVITYVKLVKRYTTTEWVDNMYNCAEKKYNDLLTIYGIDTYVNIILEKLLNNCDILSFDKNDTDLLEGYLNLVDDYVKHSRT